MSYFKVDKWREHNVVKNLQSYKTSKKGEIYCLVSNELSHDV